MQYLITLLIYFSIHSLSLALPIDNFTAQYDLYYNETYVGKTTRQLTRENNLVKFSSISKTDGIAAWFLDVTINETSILHYQNKHLSFHSYRFNETKNNENKTYTLRINKNKQLYNSYTKESYPIKSNLHDTLGFTLAIMQDLQNGEREIKYTIAEKKKLKSYTLKFIKKEEIKTNNGQRMTTKMEHYNPETKERFTLWCDEKLGFLPIRIQSINAKGNENLLNLTQFNKKKFYLEFAEEESD